MEGIKNLQQPLQPYITIKTHPHPLQLLNPVNNGGASFTCNECNFMDIGKRYCCRTCPGYNIHVECAIKIIQQNTPPKNIRTQQNPTLLEDFACKLGTSIAAAVVVDSGKAVLGKINKGGSSSAQETTDLGVTTPAVDENGLLPFDAVAEGGNAVAEFGADAPLEAVAYGGDAVAEEFGAEAAREGGNAMVEFLVEFLTNFI